METLKYAFRCKTCGHLEYAGQAATSPHPVACRVCGGGVSFSKAGIKTIEPDNWEVLADATPERLAELGLSAETVESHEPWPLGEPARPPQDIERAAGEVVHTKHKTSGS